MTIIEQMLRSERTTTIFRTE